MKEPIQVITHLTDNHLNVMVELNDVGQYEPEKGVFKYRLKKDGEILETIENQKTNRCVFILDEYGEYFVLVSCLYNGKSFWKNSKLNFYFPSFPNQYDNFLKEKDDHFIAPLKYARPAYPHQDFLLIKNVPESTAIISKFAVDHALYNETICLHKQNEGECSYSILTTNPLSNVAGSHFAFSGITRDHDHLYVGYKDFLIYNATPQSIINEISDYYTIHINPEKIQIDHDYLGLSKLYYYQEDNSFITSNNYHLLLLAMRALSIMPDIDFDRAIADLSSVSAFARINYCRNMIFKNTHMLPIDQTIEITADKISFPYTSLHEELTNPEPFSEQSYHRLLLKARDELIDNARLALEHPGYDHYIVDLSGGIDSRIVYAAISHFPEFREKIRINTEDLPSYPKDLPIALEINSLYGWDYHSLPVDHVPISRNESLRDLISNSLGANQQQKPPTTYSYMQRVMKLPGLVGELYTRPHMYTKLKGSQYEDNISVDEFVENREYYYSLAISKQGIPYFQKLFANEMKALPGDKPMVKYQNHYMFYMLTIHHSTYQGITLHHTPIWPIIQSKTLFHLNNITAMVFRTNRLAFDIMYLLNPAIASIQYEKELYNEERKKLSEDHPELGHLIRLSEETLAFERNRWSEARVKKKENTNIKLSKTEREHVNKENQNYMITLEKDVNYALRKILLFEDKKIGNIIGLDCFSRIYGSKEIKSGQKYLDYFYTKVLSMFFELNLFGYIN